MRMRPVSYFFQKSNMKSLSKIYSLQVLLLTVTLGESLWDTVILSNSEESRSSNEESRIMACSSNQFLCGDQTTCIYKHRWCDGDSNCNDYSDENYCRENTLCYPSHFACDDGMCIPEEGRCDGYRSCTDGSDELDCPCEKISKEFGNIEYSVHVGRKRSFKCWKIVVPSNKYLILRAAKIFFVHQAQQGSFGQQRGFEDCSQANITLISEESTSKSITICPGNNFDPKRTIEIFSDTEIRHRRRSSHFSGDNFDSFSITYKVADLLCKRADAFKCSATACVSKEKRCNGVRNCLNGADEHDCVRSILLVPGLNRSISLGLTWLRNQRNAAWGWRDNTHRAVVAMYLSQGANFNGTNLDEELTAKQLELQMSTAILRNETTLITPTQLAMYVNALLVICHDPRNFYGFDLVRDLRMQVECSTNATHPLPYLALCNAKEALSDEAVDKLVRILDSSSDHSFLTDVQAMALMALACVGNTSKGFQVKENITSAIEQLKKLQNEDGSFGNVYTTALVMQALLSTGSDEDKDVDIRSATEFLKLNQNKADGSFGDFLATYLILPILNAKSLTDIGKINCSENLKMPRDGNPVSDIESKLGPKMSVQYDLYVGDTKDQVHPLFLRTPANITVLEMMRLAAEADPKYEFQAQRFKGKLYIYELFGIANDPEDGKFWILHIASQNSSLEITTKSPDEISLKNNDRIVMWYRSAQID